MAKRTVSSKPETRHTHPSITRWPDEFAEIYRAKGYWRDRTLGAQIWHWADTNVGRVALVDGSHKLSYGELAARVDLIAEELKRHGLGPRSSILIALPNGWELVVLFLACLRAEIAPVMMLPAHRHHELTAIANLTEAEAIAVPDRLRGYDHHQMVERVIEDSATLRFAIETGENTPTGVLNLSRLLTTSIGSATEIERRRVELSDNAQGVGEDIAVFLLSGGTTGLSKVIARTHNDYEYNARTSASVCGFNRDTVYLVALPASHNFPLGSPGILGTLMVGGKIVLVASPSPRRVFSAIGQEGVTITAAVPAVLSRWVADAENEKPDLRSLTTIQVGGSLFAPEAYRRAVSVLGCHIQQVYGMAEGLLNFTRSTDSVEVLEHTQGRPISPHDEIKIVDTAGVTVARGQAGELLTRGPYTLRGYYRAPEHNDKSFTPDGWYKTGDLVIQRSDGNLVVVGRTKDIINRGGEKISADEIERLLQSMDEVAEVAVVPAPHPELGEVVCACLVLRANCELTLEDIRQNLMADEVAEYKIPEKLIVLDSMPQTAVGKANKNALANIIMNSNGPA